MFRRDIRLFAKCILSGTAIFLVLAVFFGVAAGMIIERSEDVYTPVKVAVVDSEDSLYSRIIVNMVSNLGYISDLLELKRVKTDDPASLLEDGYAAVITLPEGYISDILSAHVSGGEIIVSPALGAQREIVTSVARFGETLLAAGQNGTFSGLYLIKEYGLPSEIRRAYLDEVNLTLVNEALNAHDKYVTIDELDYEGTGMSLVSYYAMSWLIFLAMMMSIFFISLYTRDLTRPMLCRLCSCGVGGAKFWRWKLILTFVFRTLIVSVAVCAMSRFGIAEFDVFAIVSVVLASAFMTVFGMALTVVSRDGITLNVLISAGGLLLCGGIVPRQLLPQFLLKIGDLTPFGAAKSLLAPAFGAPVDALGVAAAVVYVAIAIAAMWARMRRITVGREA